MNPGHIVSGPFPVILTSNRLELDYISTFQSVVSGPVAATLPGHMLEIPILTMNE
jgi:hypothetical protein